jgi:predicted hydrocarbon binding protein
MTLTSSMCDGGEMKVVEREPAAVWEFVGFAEPAREICETFTGYQAERMALLGFEDVSVRHTRCRATGAQNCLWDLTWKGGRGTE